MKCDGCGKEAGFNRCGRFCSECIGGPLVDPNHRGPIPFLSAVGWPFGATKKSRMTEAYLNDIRSRKIDRTHGVRDATTGQPYARVYRDTGSKAFSYAGQRGRS